MFCGSSYISVAGFQIGSWLTSILESSLQKQFSAIPEEDSSKRSSLKTMGSFFKILIWLIIILVILDNIPNLDIAGMITGLGISGIAIGLAAQNFIGDLLSSLAISLDKPFVVGDSIQVGEFTGTVDHIGIKSTRIRSLNGEELIISNSDLLSSRIQNYEQMQERRVVFTLRLGYDTPAETLRRIPEILQVEIDQQENVRFSRVHFKEYGEVSLIYEVVYFVTSPKYISSKCHHLSDFLPL
ncbi:MAG: mechanosensitive ion channel family protein [Anaerolineaceae bacterium]